ncbi:alpha/beta hydrolase [Dysgonomonas sp. OttesenSCG-928-M03]|nr:alpha/beta hydrolase [Dysgonomonas sp. OttesenSCG-928-M03]
MRNTCFLFFLFYFSVFSLFSQQVIDLWENEMPPIANGLNDQAELFVYLPEGVNNKQIPAVLICPGGGYAGISMPYEGHGLAKWLAQNGFAGIVLKYRLPNRHKTVPFDDALKAMRIINKHSADWNIDINKIGVAGSSAGGHLAAVLSNMSTFEKTGVGVSFTILFYPVISFEEVTKGGTRKNLIGENPDSSDIIHYSANLQVSEQTPPAIIFTADNDASVSPTHSTRYYQALKRYDIPISLYIFPEGGHGWALLDSFRYNQQCMDLLEMWLSQLP